MKKTHHTAAFPASAGGKGDREAVFRRNQPLSGRCGPDDVERHDRRCYADQRPQLDQECGKKRDPEMHQTKKENQWHFSMKCHTGVDAGSGFVHTVEATAAKVHDVTVAVKLLREDDEVVYGDSAYLGLQKRDGIKQNPQLSSIEFRTNRRPGRLPKVSDSAIDWERYIENRKSAVRCKVEHPYRIVKNIFGFRKTVYRGLRKNLNRLLVLFASANLYMLVRAGGSLCSAQSMSAGRSVTGCGPTPCRRPGSRTPPPDRCACSWGCSPSASPGCPPPSHDSSDRNP